MTAADAMCPACALRLEFNWRDVDMIRDAARDFQYDHGSADWDSLEPKPDWEPGALALWDMSERIAALLPPREAPGTVSKPKIGASYEIKAWGSWKAGELIPDRATRTERIGWVARATWPGGNTAYLYPHDWGADPIVFHDRAHLSRRILRLGAQARVEVLEVLIRPETEVGEP